MHRIGYVVLALFATLLSLPAAAQQEWMEPFLRDADRRARQQSYRRPDTALPPYRQENQPPPYYAPPMSMVREPLPMTVGIPGNLIIIFRGSQQYSAYIDGRAAYSGQMPMRGPVSTGTAGRYETPLTDIRKGPHTIEYKQIDYVSNSYPEPYGGAPMPYSMFFNRKEGLAMHEGPLPRWDGRPHGVSHGCVRFDSVHARILYQYFSNETVRVIIVQDVASLAQWETASVTVYR